MKVNHYLSIMAAVLLSALSIGFTACSQDEVDEPQQTKVDLLKAKAKEFAEKYGVEMSLNEDNIAQIAETLSVEQMEKDFQNFALFKKNLVVKAKDAPVRAKTRGLKIRTSVPLEEEKKEDKKDPAEEEREKIITGNGEAFVSCTYDYVDDKSKRRTVSISGTATVSWQYGLKCACWVKVSLLVSGEGSDKLNGGGTLNSYFNNTNRLTFDANGNVGVSNSTYKYLLNIQASYYLDKLSVTIRK